MIIRTRNSGRVELRSNTDWGSTDPWRLRLSGLVSTAGVPVTPETVLGLPTATYCIRLVSMNIAQADLMVADVSNPSLPVPEPDSWQYELLHNPPADELTGFNLISDISANVEGYGNACLQKLRAARPGMTGEIVDLRPLDMERVRIYTDPATQEKRFDLRLPDGKTRTTDCSEILHIRGFTPRGGIAGMSPIQQHRMALGNFVAQQEYVGHFFRNNATPSGYISLPEGADPDPKALEEMLAEWEDAHSQENIHRPAILANGAKWNSIGINLADVAFLDGMRFSVEEMARMMFVPHGWVQPTSADRTRTIEESLIQLTMIYLRPRVMQIKAALNADPDLFPAGGTTEVVFNLDKLVKADALSESQKILRYRQGGIWTANECRVATGMPPIDDPIYDVPIIIPVGAGALPGSEPGDTGEGDAAANVGSGSSESATEDEG